MAITREQAIQVARACAKIKPESYTGAEGFMPHEWVIAAMIAASSMSHGEQQPPITDEDQNVERSRKLRDAFNMLVDEELRAGGHPANVLTALQVTCADVLVAVRCPVSIFAQRIAETIVRG